MSDENLTPQQKAAITRAKNKAAKEAAKENTSDEPVITTMGIYKTGSGWRFIKIETQGDKVISKEETDHDTLRSYCFDEFKVNSVKTFMSDIY